MCARALPDALEIDRLKVRGHELVVAIVDRAQRSGQLRSDFADGDFAFVLWSTTMIIDAAAGTGPDA